MRFWCTTFRVKFLMRHINAVALFNTTVAQDLSSIGEGTLITFTLYGDTTLSFIQVGGHLIALKEEYEIEPDLYFHTPIAPLFSLFKGEKSELSLTGPSPLALSFIRAAKESYRYRFSKEVPLMKKVGALFTTFWRRR